MTDITQRPVLGQIEAFAALAPVGIYTTDRDGRCTFVNHRWCELTGFASAQATNVPWSNVLHPEDREWAHALWLQEVAAGKMFWSEYRYLRPDGTTLWVNGRSIALPDGSGHLGIIIDITARHEADRAVRAQRDFVVALVESAGDGVVTRDLDGSITHVNRRFCEMTGFDAQILIGRIPPFPYWATDDAPADMDMIQVAARTGAREADLRFRRADGSVFDAIATIAPLMDANGAVIGYVETMKLADERQRAVERLRLLAEVSKVLGGALDADECLRSCARLVVPAIADWCAIDIPEGGPLGRRVAVVHDDPEKLAMAEELRRRYPPTDGGTISVLRDGQPLLYADIPDEMLVAGAVDAHHLALLRTIGIKSVLIVPLTARDTTLGALTLVTSESNRRYNDDDVAFAAEIGRRLGLAVDNARLFEEEQRSRREAERQSRRAERSAFLVHRLQEITAAVAAAAAPDEIATAVAGQIASAVGGSGAAVYLLEADGLTLRAAGWSGYPDEVRETAGVFTLRSPVPLAAAATSGRPIFFANTAELLEAAPQFAEHRRKYSTYGSVGVVPMMRGGRLLGAINISRNDDAGFSPDERDLLMTVAGICAQALERAQLYAHEQEARRRTQVLQKVAAQLAGALTPAQVAAVAVREMLGALNGVAAALYRTNWGFDRLELLCHEGIHTAFAGWVDSVPLESPVDLAQVARSGVAVWAERPGHDDRPLHSGGALPLVLRNETIGVLAFAFAEEHPVTEEERVLARAIADQAAQALERATLFQEQSAIAKALQESLLPPALPVIPGIDIAGRYHAAGAAMEVGGDFYDVFSSDREWSVAIGDVCGKGAEAAALTGLIRYTLRAEALRDRGPASVLRTVSDAIRNQAANHRFATAVYGRMHVVDGTVRVRLARAGHPPPRIVRADGAVELVDSPGALLGVLTEPHIENTTISLGPGDLLVLFTDGVVEARVGPEAYGDARLDRVLSACAGATADDVASRVLAAALDFQHGTARDDIAVVVVGCPPVPPAASAAAG